MTMTTRRRYSLISIACFLLVGVALVMIHNSPATGYEVCFYSSLNTLVWVFLILSIIGGITILVDEAFARNREGNWWLAGFAVVMLAYFVISIVPPLRGYVLYGKGDVLSHVGMVKDAISTGHLAEGNYYPITHTLIAQISHVSGLDYMTVMNYLPPLFAVLHVLSIHLLARVVLSDRGHILMATTCGALLVAWGTTTLASRYGVIPTSLSTLVVPLVLYFYFGAAQRRSFPHSFLLVLLLLLITFFHPLTATVLILFLLTFEFVPVLSRRIFGTRNASQHYLYGTRQRPNLRPSLILFVTLSTWMSGFRFFEVRLRRFYDWLSGDMTWGEGDVIAGRLAEVGLGTASIVELFFKLYGDIFIYCVLAVIAIVLIIRRYRAVPDRWPESILALAACFALSSSMLLMFVIFPGLLVNPMRMLGFMSVCSTVLAGYALYELCKRRRQYRAIVVSVLAVAAVVGIFHSYNSPYTMIPNYHVTQMEMKGYAWVFDRSDKDTVPMTLGHACIGRFGDAVLGRAEFQEREHIRRRTYAPDRLNYHKYQTIGESLVQDKYLVITRADTFQLTELFPEMDRLNKSDLVRLEGDGTVSKLYSNGEVDAYRVFATEE